MQADRITFPDLGVFGPESGLVPLDAFMDALRRVSWTGFALVLAFLIYPGPERGEVNRPDWSRLEQARCCCSASPVDLTSPVSCGAQPSCICRCCCFQLPARREAHCVCWTDSAL